MDNYGELMRYAAQQGAWAIAAITMFIIYSRRETKREADDKGREQLLMDIVTNNTAIISKNTSTNESIVIAINELRRDIAGLHQQREGGRR